MSRNAYNPDDLNRRRPRLDEIDESKVEIIPLERPSAPAEMIMPPVLKWRITTKWGNKFIVKDERMAKIYSKRSNIKLVEEIRAKS